MDDHIQYRQKIYKKIIEEKKYGKLTGLAGIELNVTELCNRKCTFCPRYEPKVYPNQKKYMSKDILIKLIAELQKNEYKGVIYFSGFGEPLLHPDILDNIILLKTHLPECYIEMTTNGDFLSWEKIKKISNYIDNVIIDCYDSHDQKIKWTNLFKEKSFTKYKIKELWVKPEEVTTDFMNKVSFNNRAGAVQNVQIPIDTFKQCFLPFYRITIDWNGDIILCCNDWFRQQKGLGNVLTTSFYDIWFGDTLNSVRKNLLNGKRVDSACSKCSAKGTLVGKESASLLENLLEK